MYYVLVVGFNCNLVDIYMADLYMCISKKILP